MPSNSVPIEPVARALDNGDYRTAAKLLQPFLQQSPQDPWVQFYAGRLYEVSDKLEQAESTYRKLLRNTTHTKAIAQARQGLQRLMNLERDRRQQAIDRAMVNPTNHQTGMLLLEPINPDIRSTASQKLARIFEIDPYSARTHLPHKSWRLYRTGPIGELQVYSHELQAAGIPNFSVALPTIQAIRTFRVAYFKTMVPQAILVCQDEQNNPGTLSFDWSEVSQRVEGLLPIFEEVLDEGPRRQLKHKVRTQDYTHLCDLHLPSRKCILRLHDTSYQFSQDPALSAEQTQSGSTIRNTIRINWNRLLALLNTQIPDSPLWSDFVPFAETALDYTELLKQLKAHIDLQRREVDVFHQEEMLWDPAFHLYSGLMFCKQSMVS